MENKNNKKLKSKVQSLFKEYKETLNNNLEEKYKFYMLKYDNKMSYIEARDRYIKHVYKSKQLFKRYIKKLTNLDFIYDKQLYEYKIKFLDELIICNKKAEKIFKNSKAYKKFMNNF